MHNSRLAIVAALVLALLVLAAVVTGVAESATKTAIPEKLTGKWERYNWGPAVMVVGPRGKVNVTKAWTKKPRWYHTKFSQVNVTARQLTISGPRSCSGTGRYGWTIYQHGLDGWVLRLTKIHDACSARVNLFAHDWGAGQRVLN